MTGAAKGHDAESASQAAAPAELLEVSAGDLIPAGGSSPAAAWGDAGVGPRRASSAFAMPALAFCGSGLALAIFSSWWPALVIAPLAFGPGIVFSYLATREGKLWGLAGSKLSFVAWLLGVVAAIIWNIYLCAALRPVLDVAWWTLGFRVDIAWLVLLSALGLAHLIAWRVRSAPAIVVASVLLLTGGTLVAALILETQRQARATLLAKRGGDLALGIHQFMDTGKSRFAPPGTISPPTNPPEVTPLPVAAVPAPEPAEIPWLGIGLGGAVLAGIGGLAVLSWRSRQGPRDLFLDGSMADCGSKPNCVSSKASDPAKRVAPIAFDCPVEEARRRLILAISQQPRSDLQQDEPLYIRATFRSALFRFVDDAEFRIDPAAGVIDCRSASRVGRSDFGANRRRIEAIRREFNARYMMLEKKSGRE